MLYNIIWKVSHFIRQMTVLKRMTSKVGIKVWTLISRHFEWEIKVKPFASLPQIYQGDLRVQLVPEMQRSYESWTEGLQG